MNVLNFIKSIIHLFYNLTVGLTVLVLRAGILYLVFVLAVTSWFVVVGMVTWKTYTTSGHHLGWTTCACVLTALLCGGVVVGVHWMVRDVLGLTTHSLGQLLGLMLGRRRSGPQAPRQGGLQQRQETNPGPQVQAGDRDQRIHAARQGAADKPTAIRRTFVANSRS